MYSTCIFCYVDLGSNEAIESFSVGERLAFDPAMGRLWVVCPSCGRWNLSPLDDRWESIEAADRSFHHSAVRAYTDNISIAKGGGRYGNHSHWIRATA